MVEHGIKIDYSIRNWGWKKNLWTLPPVKLNTLKIEESHHMCNELLLYLPHILDWLVLETKRRAKRELGRGGLNNPRQSVSWRQFAYSFISTRQKWDSSLPSCVLDRLPEATTSSFVKRVSTVKDKQMRRHRKKEKGTNWLRIFGNKPDTNWN